MKKTIIISIIFILMLILGMTGVFAENRNNNPLLREILIDGKEMEVPFDQFVADYVIATEKEKIKIEAITDDPNAKTQIIGNTNLAIGNNDIEIKVIAEDGTTTKSYFLHITRGDTKKANANLKNIEIEGFTLNPSFNKTDIEYLVTYTGNIEKLNIKAIAESSNAKVEILNNSNFNSTYHVVTIKVTAENGITTKEYKIRAKNVTDGDHQQEGEATTDKEIKNNEIIKNTVVTNSINEQKNNNENSIQNNNIWIYVIVIMIVIILIVFIIIKNKKKGRH